jgi:hypothetical protein
MDMIQIIVIGTAVSFNVLILKLKFEKRRYFDAALDVTTLVLLSMLFAGSLGGLQIATVASAIVSIVLWFNPPKNSIKFKPKKFKL